MGPLSLSLCPKSDTQERLPKDYILESQAPQGIPLMGRGRQVLGQLLSRRGTAGPVSGEEHYCPRRGKSWLHCQGRRWVE